MTQNHPAGGVAPVSRRVMNLAHLVTQNARRFPEQPGLVWGERTWTWREIEAEVAALAAALAARGVGKGDRILVHSKNCAEMFWSMFAAFRLGAVWVPTNFRLLPDEVAYLATSSGAKAFLCHADFPAHAEAVTAAGADLAFTWSLRRCRLRRDDSVAAADRRKCRRDGRRTRAVDHDDPCWFFFTSGTTGRSKAAVLTHGQMAFVITNHLCDLMPGDDRARRLPRRGAALARRRRAPARADCARRPDDPAADGTLRHRGSLPADRAPPRHEPVHRADDPEDAGRASGRGPLRPFLPALRHLCRRADVSRGPEAGAEDARQRARAVFRPRRGDRQHHRSAARAARRSRTGRTRASAPAASSAPACRSRSRTTRAASSPPFSDRRDLRRSGRPSSRATTRTRRRTRRRSANGWFRTGDLGHMDERRLRLHHRPRLRHVHLRRLEHLSARDRGEDPDASGHRRSRGARRARCDLGRDRHRRLRAARGQGRDRERRWSSS